MRNLFFICPSDFIESEIESKFPGENYFINSLGNSIFFGVDTLNHIRELIDKKKVDEVYFVLSEENKILKDALKHDHSLETFVHSSFYAGIRTMETEFQGNREPSHMMSMILSAHLNKKIKELKNGLTFTAMDNLNVQGLIFDKDSNEFKKIYSELIIESQKFLN